MKLEDGHPNVSLSDWQAFKAGQKVGKPLSDFDEVIDRRQLNLPDSVLPLARGGAVASTTLLRKAGYRPGTRQSQCWRRWPGNCELALNTSCSRGLAVRKFGSLWMVGRWLNAPMEELVFRFGSTPIFTRNCRSARQLAWYCFHNDLHSGLCWVRMVPKNYEQAIEFARQRTIDEAGCLPTDRHRPAH